MYARFDWQWPDAALWTIAIQAADGRRIEILDGGTRLSIDGQLVAESHLEYEGIYRRFGQLVATRQTDVDDRPMRIATEVFAVAKRVSVKAFDVTNA